MMLVPTRSEERSVMSRISAVPTRLGAAPLSLNLALMLAGLGWAYWPTLVGLAQKWTSDPQYSHGFLVAPFAVFLLWTRRGQLPCASGADTTGLARPSAWGLVLLVAGAFLRLGGAWFYFEWFEHVSLLVCLVGIVLLMGGGPLLRWAWPALAFLLFM